MGENNIIEPFSSKVTLAIIVVVFSTIGAIIGNYINVWLEHSRTKRQLLAQRQDKEIQSAIDEIENIITHYTKLQQELQDILLKLHEQSYRSELPNEILLSNTDMNEKVTYLVREISPSISRSFFRLKNFYKVPLKDEVLTVGNGAASIVFLWWNARTKNVTTSNVPSMPDIIWLPADRLTFPPESKEKSVLIRHETHAKVKEILSELTDTRKRMISGDLL